MGVYNFGLYIFIPAEVRHALAARAPSVWYAATMLQLDTYAMASLLALHDHSDLGRACAHSYTAKMLRRSSPLIQTCLFACSCSLSPLSSSPGQVVILNDPWTHRQAARWPNPSKHCMDNCRRKLESLQQQLLPWWRHENDDY
jgi:hypothetical protein